MGDKELLEFAAKAAGIGRGHWDFEYVRGLRHMVTLRMMWNPLDNDGEALRLAVKLGLYVSPAYKNEPTVFVQEWHGLGAAAREDVGNDPYAATRRAIVLAAAEIGKATAQKGVDHG